MLNNSTLLLLPLFLSNTVSASAGITQQVWCKKPISCSKHPVGCQVLAVRLATSATCHLCRIVTFPEGVFVVPSLIMQQVLEVAAFQVYLLLNMCKLGCFQLHSLLSCSALWDNASTHVLQVRRRFLAYIEMASQVQKSEL